MVDNYKRVCVVPPKVKKSELRFLDVTVYTTNINEQKVRPEAERNDV